MTIFSPPLRGVITALISPFIGGELDEEGLRFHIHRQINSGINGLLLLGSTGENPTLSDEECSRIVTIAVKEVAKKVPVLVGTGANCTKKTIEKTKKAQKLGADIALIVTPYYNKPTQEGIFCHFQAICAETELPILIYNIPSRTGTNIEAATMGRLATLPNIIGVKEASGSVAQAADIVYATKDNGRNFSLFSGDDFLTLPMISLGACGVISVLSNLLPKEIISYVEAALGGNYRLACERHYNLLPLFKGFFLETNPSPLKEALTYFGLPAGECRAPLSPLQPENRAKLHHLLSKITIE